MNPHELPVGAGGLSVVYWVHLVVKFLEISPDQRRQSLNEPEPACMSSICWIGSRKSKRRQNVQGRAEFERARHAPAHAAQRAQRRRAAATRDDGSMQGAARASIPCDGRR